MSKSNAKKFAEKLAKDKKFREELLAEEAKVTMKFAKKAGLEFTPEELKEIAGGIDATSAAVGYRCNQCSGHWRFDWRDRSDINEIFLG